MNNSCMAINPLRIDPEIRTSNVLLSLNKKKNAAFGIYNPSTCDNFLMPEEDFKLESIDILVFGALDPRDERPREPLIKLYIGKRLKNLDINLRLPFDKMDIPEDLLNKADIEKLNDDEPVKTTSYPGIYRKADQLILELSEKYESRTVFNTGGENEAILIWNNDFCEYFGSRINVADTIRIGNALLNRLIAYSNNKLPPGKSLKFTRTTGVLIASKTDAKPCLTA